MENRGEPEILSNQVVVQTSPAKSRHLKLVGYVDNWDNHMIDSRLQFI